jgi:glycosyltransferase involved in cell wall biosynthesis
LKISLVVPVFNEEDAIPIFYKAVREYDPLKEYEVEIVFINDGSKDSTENIINALAISDKLVKPLSFTRNFGKEPALFAGLNHATGDAIIPIDVDLQDPIEVIQLLIEKWRDGADMVLAKRTDRSTDGHLKRKSAEMFYKCQYRLNCDPPCQSKSDPPTKGYFCGSATVDFVN